MEMQELRAIENVANELRSIEADFPASYLAVLAYVALHERRHKEWPNIADIADAVGVHRPSMSRTILTMSDRRKGKNRVDEKRPAGARKALGLLKRVPDPVDLRMMRVHITEKGRSLLRRLSNHMHEVNNGNSTTKRKTTD
jgi:DNA-binding MarR family transcriptional regulator